MIRVLVILFALFALRKGLKILYGRYWDDGVAFDVRYSTTATFEGKTVGFQEHISSGRLPMPYFAACYEQSAHLCPTDPSGGSKNAGQHRETFFNLKRKRKAARNTTLTCKKRGFYLIDRATVRSSDIFLSQPYEKELPLYAALTVYPKEIEIDEDEIPYKTFYGEILKERFILPDPFAFRGIREYQSFDNFKQINFKAWAKTGTPMTNTYDYTISQEVLLILNVQPYCEHERAAVFEDAIRLAAFLAREYIEAGVSVCFATNGLDCISHQPTRTKKDQTEHSLTEIYDILARIDLQDNANCMPITEFLPPHAARSAVTLISSYADDTLYDWQRKATKSGAKLLWIAPCAPSDSLEYGDGIVVWQQ